VARFAALARHRPNPLPGQPSRGALASTRSRAPLPLTVGPACQVHPSCWQPGPDGSSFSLARATPGRDPRPQISARFPSRARMPRSPRRPTN